MTYLEAINYIGEARRFGMKLGLEPMQRIARQLGNPQERLRFIHLAGTNGKGSTAAFCESVLRASGHRVGLYTSPHLVSIRGRIQINREPISETAFAEGMTTVRAAIEECPDVEATFFEIITALALWYFAREKVEWIVWETGLGGRLDATNIVRPEVCVITNIGLDHTQYLGPTLADIALEKAGIIKRGVTVISGVGEGEAGEVVARQAQLQSAPYVAVGQEIVTQNLGLRGFRQIARLDDQEYALGLLGSHQVANAACALAALQRLPLDPPLSTEAIARGLESTRWPGRFEIVSEKPLIVIDGAHNSAAMKKLLETWQECLLARGRADARAHLVFASVSDKDISDMARMLLPHIDRVSLIRLSNERSADPRSLASYFPGIEYTVFESVAAFDQRAPLANPDQPMLIAGSLFLVGEMLADRRGGDGEFGLNERLETLPPAT